MGADSISDEVRGVLGEDNALAQPFLAEIRYVGKQRLVGILTGYDFEELHMPRRIEEMRA